MQVAMDEADDNDGDDHGDDHGGVDDYYDFFSELSFHL